MKLEDIDGDFYVSESLTDLERNTTTLVNQVKYSVNVDGSSIGLLKRFKSSPPVLELEFVTTTNPSLLIQKLAGKEVTVSGFDFGFHYVVGEITCDIETLHCTLKTIVINEVRDE